jgi:hypothetical protein
MYYLVAPSAWGDPNGWTINVLGSDGGTKYVGTHLGGPGGGTNIIVKDFTGGYLDPGATSAIQFTVTTPATVASYTWYAGSKVVDEHPYQLTNSPVISILDAIININEVHFRQDNDAANFWENHDWVELYVVDASAVNIGNYKIGDLDAVTKETTLVTSPATLTVNTGDYIIIHCKVDAGVDETDATGKNQPGGIDGVWDVHVWTESLSSSDDQALLYFESAGTVYVDGVCWSNQDGSPSSTEQNDMDSLASYGMWELKGTSSIQGDAPNAQNYFYYDSLCRDTSSSDTNHYRDWQRSLTMTPGAVNNLDTDGTGAVKVSDTVKPFYYILYSDLNVNQSNTQWKFLYIAQADITDGKVILQIPTYNAWTIPTDAIVDVYPGSGVSLGTETVSGNTISIPVNSISVNNTFTVTYGVSNTVTTGTKAKSNFFYLASQGSGTSPKWFVQAHCPEVDLQPAVGDHIITYFGDSPFDSYALNGMIAGNTKIFTVALADVYGNIASTTDTHNTCPVTITIDDGVADSTEDITATTLTDASDVSGTNDTTVSGKLSGSQATITVKDTEPSSGDSPRIMVISSRDNPDSILTGGTDTTHLFVYPPLHLLDAYAVWLSSDTKYKRLNVKFSSRVKSSSIGNTENYEVKNESTSNTVTISSINLLTGSDILRLNTGELAPATTYIISVPTFVMDGFGTDTLLDGSTQIKTFVPYETGINISATEFTGFTNTLVSGTTQYNVFPVWNPNGTKIAYISDKNGVCNIYTLDISNESNSPVNLTVYTSSNTEVLHFSRIDWATDSYIYYAEMQRNNNRSKLCRIPDSGGSRQILSREIYHNWFDPDYCPAVEQPDSNPRVVVSIGGDLYVFNPNEPPPMNNPGTKIIRITDVSNEYDNTVSRCLQPEWWCAPASGYPDAGELKLVFVYESRTSNESQIYVLNDVETIISTANSENTSTPSNMVTDMNDSRLTLISHQPGSASTTLNLYPKWCPSWTLGSENDGAVVTYIEDVNNSFINETFNNIDSDTAVYNSLQTTNFDIFMTHWDDPTLPGDNNDVNLARQIIANNPYNEAFMRWAPAGGDKLTYISYNDTGEYTVSIIPITVNQNVGPEGGTLWDNSFTSVDVPADALTGNTLLSVTPPLDPPATTDPRMLETGEVREFYADGEGITFDEPVTMVIHYADADQNGVVDSTDILEKYLRVWYYDTSLTPNQWVLIGGDVDEVANTLTIQTNHFSTYGIFGTKYENKFKLVDLRIYPNPFRPNDDNKNTGNYDGGIIFDNLPEDVDDIKVYNVAGDLIATKDKAIKFYSIDELGDIDDKYSIGFASDPANFGAVAIWYAQNDKAKKIASGLYIIVFTSNGESSIKKIAIIR